MTKNYFYQESQALLSIFFWDGLLMEFCLPKTLQEKNLCYLSHWAAYFMPLSMRLFLPAGPILPPLLQGLKRGLYWDFCMN